MDDSMLDPSERHDPLHQNLEENAAEAQHSLEIVGSEAVRPAEEAAMHTDNLTALEADAITFDPADRPAEEPSGFVKKGRQSTSEKAKLAAAERAGKGLSEAPAAKKADPLRLRSKKYREAAKAVDRTALYAMDEAISLVKSTSYAKFDASIELHVKVKGDAVRGTLVLPHGTGKTKKVAVADEATLERIAAGEFDFDVLLATPAQMPKLAKHAKVLGPKGLMPSPKAGTVTDDIEKAMKEISGGRVEYRTDKSGALHLGVGKVSFSDGDVRENLETVLAAIGAGKAASVTLSSTMGPGVRVKQG